MGVPFFNHRAIVDTVSRLAFGSEGDTSAGLHQRALLALGGMARHLRSKHENLSNSIVERLHSALTRHSSSEPQRLRRSSNGLSTSVGSGLHAVLIDSIGNARALQSQSLLVEHVTGSHGNLAAKHAAVKALQGYDTEEVHIAHHSKCNSLSMVFTCIRVPRLCWTLQKAILTPVSSTEQLEPIKATPGGGEMSHISYMPPAITGIKLHVFSSLNYSGSSI